MIKNHWKAFNGHNIILETVFLKSGLKLICLQRRMVSVPGGLLNVKRHFDFKLLNFTDLLTLRTEIKNKQTVKPQCI